MQLLVQGGPTPLYDYDPKGPIIIINVVIVAKSNSNTDALIIIGPFGVIVIRGRGTPFIFYAHLCIPPRAADRVIRAASTRSEPFLAPGYLGDGMRDYYPTVIKSTPILLNKKVAFEKQPLQISSIVLQLYMSFVIA